MEETEDIELLIGPVEEPAPLPAKPKKKHNTKALSEDKIASIYNLSQEGKSCAEIGAILGIGKSTASLLLRKKEKSKPVVEKKMDDAFVSQFVAEVSAPTPNLSNSKSSKDKELDKFLETFMIDDKPAKGSGKPRGKAKKNLLDDFVPQIEAPVARVVLPKEPEMDKGMMITKIHINVENFGEVLKDYIKPNKEEYLAKVSKMGVAELKSTLNLLDTTRISTSMALQMKHLLFGAAAAIEFGTSKLLLMKTEGYAEMIRRQDMEIQSCLREIALNNIDSYKGMGLEKPQTRLATLMVMSLLSLDSRNRVAAMQTRKTNAFVEPATEQKYADL